jgi:hypothetical protein
MSETEETEEETEEPETTDQPEPEGDQPEMTGDDMADLGDLADDIEAETSPDTDETETDEETDQNATGAEVEEETDTTSVDAGGGWGEMYIGTLTTVSNAMIEQHGKPGAEPIEEDLAKDLHLDEYFNEFMEQRGKSDMPPEQALLVGTTMFLVTVAGTKTDLLSDALEGSL